MSRAELRQTLREAKVQRQKSEDLLANTDRLLDQARELIERAARGGADAPAKPPARTTIGVRTRPSRR